MRDTFWYQGRVGKWMEKCFGKKVAADAQERNLRFLEEAIELVQARRMPREKMHELVDYVCNRTPGNQNQEVGGVMVTLAALCNQAGINIGEEAYKELERIEDPAVIEKVRERRKTKPKTVEQEVIEGATHG